MPISTKNHFHTKNQGKGLKLNGEMTPQIDTNDEKTNILK